MSKSADDMRSRHEAIYAGRHFEPFTVWRLAPRLWAGRNPLSEQDVVELRGKGVTHVLDLREEQEWSAPGRFGREAVDSCARHGIERWSLPIGDFSPPADAAFTAAAAWLDERYADPDAVVFAHCRAGLQRTPTILAAWLARREGIALGAALTRLAADGYPGEPLPEQALAAERWLGSQAAAKRSRDSPFASRVRGCLLGGALGDALGAPLEFMPWPAIRSRFGPRGLEHFEPAYGRAGAITDDTQMTLFTVEGLIRAEVRAAARGICHPPSIVHHAYRRWLFTQGGSWRDAAQMLWDEEAPEPDGWLIGERFLHSRRAPGNTCLAALQAPGYLGAPAVNSSKGCGGVMRAAPVGFLLGRGDGAEVFALSVEIAALTHGHPTGQLPAGVLAAAIHALVHEGLSLPEALDAATAILRTSPRHEETLRALEAARALADQGDPTAPRVESLGGGWVAEEALAIAVYAALVHADDLRAALVLAANHSGDSDSTAAICGNLLGAALGGSALPPDWLAGLEGRDVIARLADDFVLQVTGRSPFSEDSPGTPEAEAWWGRYPGW